MRGLFSLEYLYQKLDEIIYNNQISKDKRDEILKSINFIEKKLEEKMFRNKPVLHEVIIPNIKPAKRKRRSLK